MRFKISKAFSRLLALTVISALLAGCAATGTAALDGLNTIQVSDILPAVSTEKVNVYITYPEVLKGTLAEAGIPEQSVSLICDIIESDIAHGFTSAQLAVVRNGRLVYENAWGSLNSYYPDGSPIPESERTAATTDTLYDLASITKMFGVNYALQKLVTDGEIDLDASVSDYLGEQFYEDVIDITYEKGANPDLETQKEWKASLTIRDLLLHEGGFPSDPRYFNPHLNTEKQEYDPSGTNLLFAGSSGDEETREATFDAICRTPLLYEPGTQTLYSDVDYMIEDSLKFIPEGASPDHPAVKSAQSLLSVYTARAKETGDPRCEDRAAVLQEKLDSIVN